MTLIGTSIEFGYYPRPLTLAAGQVSIRTLDKLDEKVSAVSGEDTALDGWLYAPPAHAYHMGHGVRRLPYATRVFGLPKTHIFEHAAPTSPQHIEFHVWSLSFFLGIRLTTTEAGFIDATPIEPGKLNDFVLSNRDLKAAVDIAETFWLSNQGNPRCAQLFAAAVHALFIAQYPLSLQFEEFIYLYTALDACYALASILYRPPRRLKHGDRIQWMCRLFGTPVPGWADTLASRSVEIALLRNATIHEALFVGQPLGFALHGVGTGQNLPLEMEALICRILVALIGARSATYVQTAVSTRQTHGLSF